MMKQRSECYFYSNCASKSHSKLPQKQFIADGQKMDEQYFRNLPPRERKLLKMLMRDHESYANLRNRLVSVSRGSDQIRSEYKTPLYIDRACNSCNYFSYYSKPMRKTNIKKHLVHPHQLHQSEAEKYMKTGCKKFGSENHIAIRRFHSDRKNICSKPFPCLCNSLSKYSSNAVLKERAIKGNKLGTSELNKSYTRPKRRAKKVPYYFDDEIPVHVPGDYETYYHRQKKLAKYTRKSQPYKILQKPVSSRIYLDKSQEHIQEGSVYSNKFKLLLRKNSYILKKDTRIPSKKKISVIEIVPQHFHKHEKLSNSKNIKLKKRNTFGPKDLNILFCECGPPIYLTRVPCERKRFRSYDIQQKNRFTDPSLTQLAYNRTSLTKLESPYFQLKPIRKRTVLSDYYHPIVTESKNSDIARKGSKRGYNAKLMESSHGKNKQKRHSDSLYELLAPVHNFSRSTSTTRNPKQSTTCKSVSSICVLHICDSYYRFKKRQRRNNERFYDRSIRTEKYKISTMSTASSNNCKTRNNEFRTAQPILYNSKLKRRRERNESYNVPALQAFKIQKNTDFYKRPSPSDIKEKIILAKCHTDSNLTSVKKRRKNNNKRYISEHSTLHANTTDRTKCKSSGIGILQLLSRLHNHKNERKIMQRCGFPATARQKKISSNSYNQFSKINQLGQEKEDYVTKSILKATKRNREPRIVDLRNIYKKTDDYESMQTNGLRKQNRFQTDALKKTVSFNSNIGNKVVSKESRYFVPNCRKKHKSQYTKYYYLSDNHKERKNHSYFDLNMKVSQENKKFRRSALTCYECRTKPHYKYPEQTNTESLTSNAVGSSTSDLIPRSKIKKCVQTDSHSDLKVSLQPKRVTRLGSNLNLRKSGYNHLGNKNLFEQTSKPNTSNSRTSKRKQKNNILEPTPASKCHCKRFDQKTSLPLDEDISTGKYKFSKNNKAKLKSKRNSNDIPSRTKIKKSKIALDENQYDPMDKRESRMMTKHDLSKLVPLSTNSGKFRKLRNLRTNCSTSMVRSQNIPRMPAELEKILMMPPHRRVFTVGSNLRLSIQFYKEDYSDHVASNANEEHSHSLLAQQRVPSSFEKGLKSLGALKIFKRSGEKEDKVPKTYHSIESTKGEVTKSQIKHDVVKKKTPNTNIKNKKSKGNGQKNVMEQIEKRRKTDRNNKSLNDVNKYNIQNRRKSTSTKDSPSKISLKSPDYNYDKSTCTNKGKSISFYECEPHICVPGECDPNVCFKIFKSKMKHFKHATVLAKTDVKSKSVGTVVSAYKCSCLLKFKNGKNIDINKSSASIKAVSVTKKVVRAKKQGKLSRFFRKSRLIKAKQTKLIKNDRSMETLMPYSKKKFKKSMSHSSIKIPDDAMLKKNKQSTPLDLSLDVSHHASVEHPDKYDVKLKHEEKIETNSHSSNHNDLPSKKPHKQEGNFIINSKSSKDDDLPRKKLYKQEEKNQIGSKSPNHNDLPSKKVNKQERKFIINSKSAKHDDLPSKKLNKQEEKDKIDSKSSMHDDLPRAKAYKQGESIIINSKPSKHDDLPRKRKYEKIDKHYIRNSGLDIQVVPKSSLHDISNTYPKGHKKQLKRKEQNERGDIERPQGPDPNTLKVIDIINERGPIDTCKFLQNLNAIAKSVRSRLTNLFMKKDQRSINKIQSTKLLHTDNMPDFQNKTQPITTATRPICECPHNVGDNIACLKIKDNIIRKSVNTNTQQIKYQKNTKSIQTCGTTSRNQIKEKPAPDVKLSVCEDKKVNNNANNPEFSDKKKITLESSGSKNHIDQPKPGSCVSRPKSVPGFIKSFYRKKNVSLTKQECPKCMKDILFNVPPSTSSNLASAQTKYIKSESEIKKVLKKKTREKENTGVKVKPSPLFDMIVDAKTMKVTNKDEIYRTLGNNRCGPIAEQNLKESSKNKMLSVIDLVIDRDSANILNCEQMYWALDNTRKRNKKSAFTLKNVTGMNQPYCRHLQKDYPPYKAYNATPQFYSNHCSCCFCSNDAEVSKLHHPKNCTCCICRYGCRFGIMGKSIGLEKYGTESRKALAEIYKEKEKLIAQTKEEKRVKSEVPEPGVIASLSSGVQNFAKQLRNNVRPCYCGQNICAKIGQTRQATVPPPCVCGSTICKRKYTRKTPYYKKKEEQKKITAKKKKQRRERLRKESLARINLYAKKDAAMRRKIKRQDEKAMKELEKYINHPDASSWVLLSENASDIGRLGINTTRNMLTSLIRGICHPRDIHNRVKLARAHPRAAAFKAWQNFRGSGLSGTVARVTNRCAAMQTSQYLIARAEANPITNYLFHLRSKDPRERMITKNPEIELTTPNNCSPFLSSLRKKPCMWLYHICPRFYPHCLSLLSVWRRFVDVILFILAVGIWTPCILLAEFCRSLLCCFMFV